MSRHRRWPIAVLVLAATVNAPALVAQQARQPETIDILVDPTPAQTPADMRECEARRDAAKISGEIVVCGQLDPNARHRLATPDGAKDRFAKETMNREAPPPPDPCGPMCGIFKGEPTVKGICGIGLNPCPPPPAYMVDFTTLPEAPPGSDADRIARGLPPLGNEQGNPKGAEPISPSGSASPAEGLSD